MDIPERIPTKDWGNLNGSLGESPTPPSLRILWFLVRGIKRSVFLGGIWVFTPVGSPWKDNQPFSKWLYNNYPKKKSVKHVVKYIDISYVYERQTDRESRNLTIRVTRKHAHFFSNWCWFWRSIHNSHWWRIKSSYFPWNTGWFMRELTSH